MRLWMLVLTLACAEEPMQEPIECTLDPLLEGTKELDPGALAFHLDATEDENLRIATRDLTTYLERAWGVAPEMVRAKPEGSFTLWLSTSEEARASIGADREDGFVLKQTEAGLVAWAPNNEYLVYAIYELLEQIGIRFFHPLDEYVPELGSPRLPASLDLVKRPAFPVRGIHLHTLHPIEWFDAFNGSELEEAKRMIDWLVKTGQNHVQWAILGTMDLEAWRTHARAIVEYAHSRNVTAGVDVLLFARSALQNNFVLARSDEWENELDESVAMLLDVGFDQIELGLGEFLSEDPEEVIRMLDRTVATAASIRPSAQISVVNHVGNFPNLWVDYRGMREFFYFIPAHADPRLTQSVHTVFFYDLFRDWGGYGHDDGFGMHRDFLFSMLEAGRSVRYKPESAYWVSADVDVPLFLPEYVHSRWLDIHRLHEEVSARGLPPIEGHVTFSSGHEWGYWMTDYLTAKMMWAPEKELGDFFAHYAGAFGSCADEVQGELTRFTELQSEYLFDRRLVSYLSGDDLQDDLGAVAGFVTIPARVPFQALLEMDPDQRAAFSQDVIAPLASFAEKIEPIEQTLERICEGTTEAMSRWCREIRDGAAIVRLRAEESAALYSAVERARRAPAEARARVEEANAVIEAAAEVIARREADYRFPLDRVTGGYSNPTIYRFGYLRQAHLTCYWRRMAVQAERVVETFAPPLLGDLPTCLE